MQRNSLSKLLLMQHLLGEKTKSKSTHQEPYTIEIYFFMLKAIGIIKIHLKCVLQTGFAVFFSRMK